MPRAKVSYPRVRVGPNLAPTLLGWTPPLFSSSSSSAGGGGVLLASQKGWGEKFRGGGAVGRQAVVLRETLGSRRWMAERFSGVVRSGGGHGEEGPSKRGEESGGRAGEDSTFTGPGFFLGGPAGTHPEGSGIPPGGGPGGSEKKKTARDHHPNHPPKQNPLPLLHQGEGLVHSWVGG